MIYLTVRALDKKERKFLVLAVHRTLRWSFKNTISQLMYMYVINIRIRYICIYSQYVKKKLYDKRGNQIDLKVGPN